MARASMSALLVLLLAHTSSADLVLGPISDFEDGTLQGWDPPAGNTANVAGGPAGSTRFLEVSPAIGNRLAVFNANINGNIDPAVSAINVDMMRPSGQTDLEMRLVLFGPGTDNRWTSTDAQVIPGDGAWYNMTFSILESDLTQVLGDSTFAELTTSLNRLMFRWDPGDPDASGTAGGTGMFGIDNVAAVPEAGAFLSVLLCGLACGGVTGCRWLRGSLSSGATTIPH